MVHVTCLCHGLHRLAEKVREKFMNVDELIGQTKAVFAKAPLRVQKYREMCPELMLPPKPIYTRWGTWLEAVSFYATNFQDVKAVF